jgi:hypothetical protein
MLMAMQRVCIAASTLYLGQHCSQHHSRKLDSITESVLVSSEQSCKHFWIGIWLNDVNVPCRHHCTGSASSNS